MSAQPIWTLSSSDLLDFQKVLRVAGQRIAILVAQLDPDGLASAVGLAAICQRLGIEAAIYYGGQPGHPQTLHLLQLFGFSGRLRPVSEFDWGVPVALVDSSALDDYRLGGRSLDPVIVIDHHDGGRSRIDAAHFWYLAPCGAASSLVVHLASELDSTFSFDEVVATALAVGIETDTDGFKRPGTTKFDRRMSTLVMEAGSEELFRAASSFTISERCCRVVEDVLTSRDFVGDTLVAGPSSLLEPHEGEYLAMAAELLAMHEQAECVFVWGVAGDQIRLSVRTRHAEIDLKSMLAALFGSQFSGAKPGAGGAHLPIELAEGQVDRCRRLEVFHQFPETLRQGLMGLTTRP